MASKRNSEEPAERPPATTMEALEDEAIAGAYSLAQKQIKSGEASSQVITHFLKLGSSREKLEQERLKKEVELLQVKRETLEAAGRLEGLIQGAVEAMQGYKTGLPPKEDEYEELEG